MLTNKYSIVYNDIITRAKNRFLDQYTELHPVYTQIFSISEDLEGRNDLFVRLTPRENFLCYLCLFRMAEDHELEEIKNSFNALVPHRSKNAITSKNYESIKLQTVSNKSNLNQNLQPNNITNYV